jgi:hypothetical protein
MVRSEVARGKMKKAVHHEDGLSRMGDFVHQLLKEENFQRGRSPFDRASSPVTTAVASAPRS